MPTPIPYAYVLATPFSGTTLLSLLLDSHPDIVSVGEVDNGIHEFPADLPYPCSCGRSIGDCPFFTAVRDLCQQDGIELDLQNFRMRLGHHLGSIQQRLLFGSAIRLGPVERMRDGLLGHVPAYHRHVEAIFDRNVAMARAALRVSGKSVFVDASKSAPRVAHLLRRPEIEVRIIHVVRDVRAVAWSAAKRSQNEARLHKMARFWARTHTAARRLCERVGGSRYYRFRWEDFCACPTDILNDLCRFMNVNPVDLIGRVNSQTHHVIGNRMRLQPVGPIQSDDTWQQALEPARQASVARHAGDLLRAFGYV